MDNSLEHVDKNCTGLWTVRSRKGGKRMICEACSASHPATPENRMAAVNEKCADSYLRTLTREGQSQLRDHEEG